MTFDISRHLLHFNPQLFKGRIDIIGVGAVGSKIAMEVAKLGLKDIHVWDGDEVEAHNLPNQAFYLADIGKPKVQAIAEHIKMATGTVVTQHNEFIEGSVPLGRVVFLGVDTMEHRKKIFENCLKNKFATEQVIEVRMGVEELRVYGFNPNRRNEINDWVDTLVEDSKTVESACSAKTTVGATASLTAAFAVTRFMQWFKEEQDFTGLAPSFEHMQMLRPPVLITR